MIKSPSKELTLIIYNTPKPPRYIRVNKGLLKSLVIVVPVFIILSISLSFLYSAFLKNKINVIKSKEPEIIEALNSKNKNLLKQIYTLKKANKELTTKLSQPIETNSSASSLYFFTPPVGMKDLRDKELVKFENISVTSNSKNVVLKFNLSNNSPQGDKLSGYISVVQYQGSVVQFYPEYDLSQKNMKLEFSKGESFSFSRFRPTEVVTKKLSTLSTKYKVYIFSRTGDLLVYKQLGPFNVD